MKAVGIDAVFACQGQGACSIPLPCFHLGIARAIVAASRNKYTANSQRAAARVEQADPFAAMRSGDDPDFEEDVSGVSSVLNHGHPLCSPEKSDVEMDETNGKETHSRPMFQENVLLETHGPGPSRSCVFDSIIISIPLKRTMIV